MKKNFKTIAAFAMAAFMTTTQVACNDELEMDEQSTYEMSNKAARDIYPLGCGYNNIVGTRAEIAEMRVPVASDDITIQSKNSNITYKICKDKKGYYLDVQAANTGEAVMADHIVMTDAQGKTKELDVYVQKDMPVGTRGAADVQAKDARERASQFLGFTINLGSSDLNCAYQALKIEPDSINILNMENTVKYNETSGSSMNEVSKMVCNEFGASIPVPADGLVMTFGITAKYSKNRVQKSCYEYMVASRKIVSAEAIINMAGFDNPANLTGLLSYELNNALNNPQSNTYQKYRGKEGARRLLNMYGTHVITQCQLGAMTQSMFSKKNDFSSLSVEESLGLTLQVKAADGAAKQDSTWKANKSTPIALPGTEFQNTYKNQLTEICESMEAQTDEYIRGGKGIRLSSWTYDEKNPAEWAMIACATQNVLDQMPNNGGENLSLKPIYEFCVDSTRKAQLMELLTPDANGKIEYFDYVSAEEPRVIIADVKMMKFEGKNLGDKDGKPMYMKDRFGVVRQYFPMIQNQNFGYATSDDGKPLNFNNTHLYGWGDEKNYIHNSLVCYYALDYDTDAAKGIVSVRLGDQNTKLMSNEYKDDVYTYQMFESSFVDPITYTKIFVKYADDDTKSEDKITGVGWFFKDNDKVFTSTMGTDWTRERNDKDLKKFFAPGEYIVGENADFARFKAGIWPLYKENVPERQIAICYTTKPLEYNISARIKAANK